MKKVCLVFDIGRRNKKYFLFNENLQILEEDSTKISKIKDEDGDDCEDLLSLSIWIKTCFKNILSKKEYEVVAVNCSAFAATWVHLSKDKEVVAPLYSSHKTYPNRTRKAFDKDHNQGGKLFAETGSPNLGMLNSGLQLYWLKNEKTEVFKKVAYSLPLAQYCLFLLHQEIHVGRTSIGCHSALWNYKKNTYHQWVKDEKLDRILAKPTNNSKTIVKDGIHYGIGIHNSSAALVPYLKAHKEPFILLSTGEWTITFNPFCSDAVDEKHLEKDALTYFRYDGKTVRGSRLFSGDEHKRVAKYLGEHFGKDIRHYLGMKFDAQLVQKLRKKHQQFIPENTEIGNYLDCPFMERNINEFENYETAYHQFMMDLVAQQILSIKLTFGKNIPKFIFVDGGFAENDVFMSLLDEAFFNKKLYANKSGQASGLGAAMVIEKVWKPKKLKLAAMGLTAY